MQWIQGVGAIPGVIEYGSPGGLVGILVLIASIPFWVALAARTQPIPAVQVEPVWAQELDEPQRRAA